MHRNIKINLLQQCKMFVELRQIYTTLDYNQSQKSHIHFYPSMCSKPFRQSENTVVSELNRANHKQHFHNMQPTLALNYISKRSG